MRVDVVHGRIRDAPIPYVYTSRKEVKGKVTAETLQPYQNYDD